MAITNKIRSVTIAIIRKIGFQGGANTNQADLDGDGTGDACDSVSYRRNIPSQITLDGFESDNNPGIAGAWVNSCGTDYAEWVGDTYYAAADTDVESPLVLGVLMSGKDAKVTLTIDLP